MQKSVYLFLRVRLQKWFQLLEQNRQEIAEIMTSESGKPIAESLGEITYGNSFVEWFAEEARRIYGEIVPSPNAQRQILLTREPIGVATLITPWNFPHAMITRKASAALAAGIYIIRPVLCLFCVLMVAHAFISRLHCGCETGRRHPFDMPRLS